MEENATASYHEQSFLTARVPSIEPWKKPIVVVPKHLCNTVLNLINNEQYKVYLRIKPVSTEKNTFDVLDENTLLTNVPEESVSYKILSNSNSLNLQRKFAFTAILGPESAQSDVFNESILPPLKLFLQGEDSLVMAYGTTSAGKTFTMQGTSHHPGVIPRALSYIFRSLEGKLELSGTLQPFRGTQLLPLSPTDLVREKTFKNQILNLDLAKYQYTIGTSYISFQHYSYSDEVDFKSQSFEEMEIHIGSEDKSVVDETTDRFSVWLSMIEIYNDTIIDLLQFPNEKGARNTLYLGEDERGGFFAKNAKQIHVRNGHEAYQISQFGRTNLHRAPTALNDKSSRSHCILTVTLVRHQKDFASCHRISFVDLAGSERVKKTLNAGKRLIETKAINKSLSVLGKCLQVLKSNQSGRSANQIVPVRDSKMTKLFKNAMMGVEKLTFIINISTDPLIFDETLHVLKFSALAQEIMPKIQSARTTTRFSRVVHSNRFRDPSFAWSAYSSVADLTDKSDDHVDRFKKVIDDAEKKISQLNQTVRAYKMENEELEMKFTESEKRAEGLTQLLLENQQDLKTIQFNLNEHLRKVMGDKNKEKESDLATLREKCEREKNNVTSCLNEHIKELKLQINDLKSKLKATVSTDVSYDAAYQSLKDENLKLRSDKKGLAKLLDEASLDYELILNENFDLKKEISEQLDKIVELEVGSDDCEVSQEDDALPRCHEHLQTDQDKINEKNAAKILDLENLVLELNSQVACLGAENQKVKQKLAEREADLKETENRKALEAEELLRQVRESQDKDLKNQLAHEKSVAEFLEKEVEILRNSVKESCAKESVLRNEVASLKAAAHSLEYEGTIACDKLTKQILAITGEKAAVEKSYLVAQNDLQRLKEELSLKETGYLDKLKSLETELMASRKNFQVAEYQIKVFEMLKEKSEQDFGTVPELKETIERLECELLNKEREFIAFENGRKFVIDQHDIEVKKYLEEIDRLKRDVEFSRDFMLENLKSSTKKEEVKMLQDQLTAVKLAFRENFNDRSPLRNRTNIIVPCGNLVEISPFNKIPFCSKKQQDEDNVPLNRIFCSLDNLPQHLCNTPAEEVNPQRKSVPNSPQVKAKSGRKPRTARKRDPADHPALGQLTRGRRRPSVSPPVAIAPNVKKKLFSCDDFVELSDQDDLFQEVTNLERKRTLRPRTNRKN